MDRFYYEIEYSTCINARHGLVRTMSSCSIHDRQRHDGPLAVTYSIDDAEKIVAALNGRP